MNVNETRLAEYLHVFHETYVETAHRFVPEDRRQMLARYSHLPTGIVGYVSTMAGAGYEYFGPPAEGIRIVVGSRPVEDLLLDAPSWLRKTRELLRLGGAQDLSRPPGTFVDTSYKERFPFRLVHPANVRFIRMTATARSWRRFVSFAELATDRTSDFWSEAKAVVRAKDEVLQALVDLRLADRQQVSFGEYLSSFKARHVLVLGDFSPQGRERLERIRESLHRHGYVSVVLDEIPEYGNYDLRQKLLAVASVCRFIVIDDSSKAGQLAEIPYVDLIRAVTLVLRLNGTGSSYVVRPLSATSTVIRELTYSMDSLDAVVASGTQWAEVTVARLGGERQSAYPWREDIEDPP